MAFEAPPLEKQPPGYAQSVFRPGDGEQDLFTLPLEIGVIASLNAFYTPRAQTFPLLWDEDTAQSNDKTTYSRSSLLPYAVGTGALIFGGLGLSAPDFRWGPQLRGFAHALLLAEVGASSAKVIVQKKRPNYDSQVGNHDGQDTADSRASFYSDHANQAFAFGTYTSLLLFQFSGSPVLAATYSAVAATAAGIVSYSRVQDHAHNLSDVIVGACMGSLIAGWTFFRVQDVETQAKARLDKENKAQKGTTAAWQWHFTPGLVSDDNHKTWYTAHFQAEI